MECGLRTLDGILRRGAVANTDGERGYPMRDAGSVAFEAGVYFSDLGVANENVSGTSPLDESIVGSD
jgi:hypothetical protein